MGESKTSERRIAAKEKRARAVELRRSGANYQEIADQLGYASRGRAYTAVSQALAEIPAEAVADLRRLEGARLDALQMGMWKAARSGSLGAVDRIIRIMERRARLFGLDAPIAINARVTGELEAQIEELVNELAGGSQPAAHPEGRPGGVPDASDEAAEEDNGQVSTDVRP